MQEHVLNIPLSQGSYNRLNFGGQIPSTSRRWALVFSNPNSFPNGGLVTATIPGIKCQRDARPLRTCSSRLFDCDGVTDEITPVACFGQKQEPVPRRFVFLYPEGFSSFARPTEDEESKTSLPEKL